VTPPPPNLLPTPMKTFVAIAIVAGLVSVGLLGGVVRESRSAVLAPVLSAQAASLRPGLGSQDTVGLLRRLQNEVRARPGDAQARALLGLAYAQRARETGDAAYVTRADAVLRQARALDPKNVYALTGLGGVALSRHRFADALALGFEARRAAPRSAEPYGVVGDALLELGRYEEAFATFDRMVALKPSASSYARIAYARELTGDVVGAIEAMSLALDASLGRPEASAFATVELGKLHWSVGRIGQAAAHYRLALRLQPGYAPAIDALARVEASRGRLARAIALQRRAVEAVPLPAYVSQLGDLLARAGRASAAKEQYELVAAIERLQVASGATTDLETALFRVDHGIRLRESLALARKARAARPSVAGDDLLAWALVRNGRCAEARSASERSLRLGQRDAGFFFHRGMIERCLGNRAAARRWFARAVALNPHFSVLWAPVARKAVSR
jgi:tetratricopeptide (TPR) repeat protein